VTPPPQGGRVVLVTGSASGIGAACAQRFLDAGDRVVLLDVSPSVQETAARLDPSGQRALAFVADVTDVDRVRDVVAQVEQRLGRVQVLVNNAGFPLDSYLSKMPPGDWHRVLDVVLTGAFNCSQACIEGMMAQRYGRIVNVSSRSHLGNPGQTNYSAAKAGLLGFTRALALESGSFGITVNAVAPGFVETEAMTRLDNYEVLKQRSVDKSPLKRVGHPGEIAAAIAFLCSDDAAFITGETLHVTGGRYS
jgi:3-oxoacyl-[acyl-carrier protein] reductase